MNISTSMPIGFVLDSDGSSPQLLLNDLDWLAEFDINGDEILLVDSLDFLVVLLDYIDEMISYWADN